MQLIEFFLWRNLKNVGLNYFWSSLGQLLVTVQPIAALSTLPNATLKTGLLAAYAGFVVFLYSKYGNHQPNTKVYNGHLQWNWAQLSWVEYLTWLAFLSFALVYNGYYEAVLVALVLLVITYYSYSVHRTAGSLWCWSINLSMLAYAVYLLVVLPFREHGVFCWDVTDRADKWSLFIQRLFFWICIIFFTTPKNAAFMAERSLVNGLVNLRRDGRPLWVQSRTS